MIGQQKTEFQPLVDQWIGTAVKYGKGIEEDTMEFPIEYPVRVAMHKYTKAGLFRIPDPAYTFIFANPQATIGVRLVKAKAHINRLTRCVEEVDPDIHHGTQQKINVWHFLYQAMEQFTSQHPGLEHDITLESWSAHTIESYATFIKQTQELQIACGINSQAWTGGGIQPPGPPTYYLMLRTPVHTVCPFILHETGGDEHHVGPSHTQRAYIQVEMWSENPPIISPLLREINTRLQPCQSSMKIPDEAVQVLRAYSAPTYTEDAVLRVLKIVRGIKDELCPGGKPMKVKVHVQSQESIFQNDMTSEAEDAIA